MEDGIDEGDGWKDESERRGVEEGRAAHIDDDVRDLVLKEAGAECTFAGSV